MSGTGKSLQDIYDAGSKRLDELEQAQGTKFTDGGSHGVEELGRIESSVMQKMDKSLAELEGEVRQYIDKAVESIKTAVGAELDENTKFLERLQEAMKLSCNSLSEDVKLLRESIVQKFDSTADHCMTMQRRELDKGTGAMRAEGARSATQLKELSQTALTSFGSRGASNILQVLDKNIKVPSEFFAEFSRNALSIDKRINDCLLLLTARSKEIIADLSSSSTEVQGSLTQVVQQLSVDLEEVHRKSESELRKHCEDALSAALRYQEELSANLARELEESHQSSGSGIAEKQNGLNRDTDRLLEQVKEMLSDVDLGVRNNCTEATVNFEASMKERLEGARAHNKIVADERSELMERIAGDLKEIEGNFEKRLGELAQRSLEKLSSACVEAELAIISAHDTCAAEFKAVSSQQQSLIDQKTTQLLQHIETLRSNAVSAIKNAAGDNGQAPAQTAASANLDPSSANNPFGDLKL